MDRGQFEHVIAAAADVVDLQDIIVIGSQAILGPCPQAPATLLRSMEADVYPKREPERAIEIDASLGDGSRFHQTFGYYARGVGPETAKAPRDWEDRLVVVEIPPRPSSPRLVRAHCLEPHDLVLAKCVAGRDRDWDFAGLAVASSIVGTEGRLARIGDLPVSPPRRDGLRRRLETI